MIVWGLDIATKTGWCIGEYDPKSKKVEWMTFGRSNFEPKRGEGKGIRFLRFRRWLLDRMEEFYPDVVVYEQAHYRGGAATEVLVGLTTVLQEVCDEAGIPYATVRTGPLKKFATGKGNASKGEMVVVAADFAEAHNAGAVENDDEADAIHVFRWATENYAA